MKKYVDSDSEIDDEDIEELEALLAKKFHRGKGKYKGKMPIICFNCHEVGHISARCPKKKNKDEKYGDKYKSRRDDDNKSYKDKGKKSCYIAEKDSDDESSNSEEIEVVYVSLKDDSNDDNSTTLISYVNKNDKWIIDSGYLHT